MNHPDGIWLSAYHDGELRGERLRFVEAHLAACATCRKELEALQGLSRALKEVPSSPVQSSPAVFRSRVLSRLGEDPEQPPWWRALRLTWQLSPLAVLLVWAFVQAMLAVVGLMGVFVPPGAWISSLPLFLFSLLTSIILAILLWSWLAAWWAYQRHQEFNVQYRKDWTNGSH